MDLWGGVFKGVIMTHVGVTVHCLVTGSLEVGSGLR